jgi:hypothetical protein
MTNIQINNQIELNFAKTILAWALSHDKDSSIIGELKFAIDEYIKRHKDSECIYNEFRCRLIETLVYDGMSKSNADEVAEAVLNMTDTNSLANVKVYLNKMYNVTDTTVLISLEKLYTI